MSRTTFLMLLVTAIATLCGLAWHYESNVKTTQPYICRDCNLIVVGFDALQAAHVAHLGYERATTPTLDALAARGYTFTQNISPASWTVPSFMSIFTSTYPSTHGIVNKFVTFTPSEKVLSDLKTLSPSILTLAEIMQKAGYRTGGFTGDAGVSGKFGYREGFDIYVDDQAFGSMQHSMEGALQWIDREPQKKFFMFFHGYDAHGQFDIPSEYQGEFMPSNSSTYAGTKKEQELLRERGLRGENLDLSSADVAFWRAWYDSKIKDADARLADFLEELEKRGLLDTTIILVVSDHGTEFYEHGRFDHGHTLYDELLHVPLIITPPKLSKAVRINTQTSSLDIVPTILDMLVINPGEAFQNQIRGQSLINRMSNPLQEGHDVYLETDYRNYVHLRGIRTPDGWKYILSLDDGSEQLFNLRNDPRELNNLITVNPEKKNELRRRLLAHMRDALGQTLEKPVSKECLPVYDGQCI